MKKYTEIIYFLNLKVETKALGGPATRRVICTLQTTKKCVYLQKIYAVCHSRDEQEI